MTSPDGGTAVDVVADAGAAGSIVAERIAALLKEPRRIDGRVVLGCPAGRTPRTTYSALADLAAERALDLSRLVIVMMDEYVEHTGTKYVLCPPDAPYSCRRFAEHELRGVLDERLSPARQVATHRVRFPDPADPEAYEEALRDQGVDLFILATGASDGHVAFNPPGSDLDSRTRVVPLADSTRRDNLATFPSFRNVDEVPRFGLTVGLGTIADVSASVVLLVLGADKRFAFQRTTSGDTFDPSWPASVVHACRDARIVADRAATGG